MMNQTQLKEVETLFGLGAHLGHRKSKLHPKAKKNVYQIINGTTVIDLTATVEQIEAAKKFMKQAGTDGKKIMVVGTKKTAAPFVKEYCTANKVAFISTKWLPGLLTNFKTIMNNVKKLKDNNEEIASGQSSLVKHEITKMQKDTVKLERLYGGIAELTERPDILFVIDTKKEKNAVKEAMTFKIPMVAIVDTNSDPECIQYPIVANDDAKEVVEYLVEQVLGEYIKAAK
ncbi:30S ribosomal protein S2 [Candidatus Woesebacteria bacterium]|nr:30S ribosomal protein S2 [Candidatus Woesebacteria bacterium]